MTIITTEKEERQAADDSFGAACAAVVLVAEILLAGPAESPLNIDELIEILRLAADQMEQSVGTHAHLEEPGEEN